ncbi:MAG: TrmO family methyltransferase [Tannerellaceae bacterium]|jgi:formylmethanofuran dehydrogenase subunit E|nr:TrmO family methyltransferase [Tannerellaceae bacterium]
MTKIEFKPIGKVVSNPIYDYDTPLGKLKSEPGKLSIDPEYTEALFNINACEYLDVVFYFDRLSGEEVSLSGKTHSGIECGVFASRSPRRPNLIGVTTVKLVEVRGNELIVEGLDALDGTPILDIKCCDTSLLEQSNRIDSVHLSLLKADPRMEINNDIAARRADMLLLKAGQLHGHICPGLAMGIMASLYAIDSLHLGISDLNHLRVIAEVRNCLTDGVQFVTACTFAKKDAFMYKESGDVAFVFYTEEGKGIRIRSRDESPEIIRTSTSESNRAFETLKIPFERLFTVSEVTDVMICAETMMEKR